MSTKIEQEESITSPRHSKKKLFVWQMISGVLFAALLITLLFTVVKPTDRSQSNITGNIILANSTIDQKAITNAISFLKEAFDLTEVEVKNTVIEDGLYKITISIEGDELDIYSTPSGNSLIIEGIGLFNKEDFEAEREEEKRIEEDQAKIKVAENYSVNTESTLDDFKNKPSVIFFVGTYCGHCQNMVPEVKSLLWDSYKDKANIWVNVIDDRKFEVSGIAQGYNYNLDFEEITGEECMYIPSFVVLDKDGGIALSSCGSGKTVSDIKQKLEDLLK